MQASKPLDVLYVHDRWATEQLINACAGLTDAQLDQPFAIGRGSLRKTLVHMLNVITGWGNSIQSGAFDPPLDATASIDAIKVAFPKVHDALHQLCETGNADDVLNLSRGSNSLSAPRGTVLTHVLTHGTHHRAQALNMLRQLGVASLPKSSVLDWMLTTGATK